MRILWAFCCTHVMVHIVSVLNTLRGREEDRQVECSHLLVTPHAHIREGWGRQKLAARDSIQVCHMGPRNPATWYFTDLIQSGHWQKAGVWSGAGTWKQALHSGYGHHSVHQMSTPMLSIFFYFWIELHGLSSNTKALHLAPLLPSIGCNPVGFPKIVHKKMCFGGAAYRVQVL